MIKISVVVPVYNVEKYLDQCLQSLLSQTVSAYELILVDDGSKDSSGKKCDEWAEKHECIHVIHKQNAGLGMARNSGMKVATGDYVIFIDSDDYCDADFLETISRMAEQTGCDTCKTIFRRVDLQGKVVSEEQIEKREFNGDEIRKDLIPRLLGSCPEKHDSIPMSSCCTLYSMDIIRSNHLQFFSEREWISEDILFNIEYLSHAHKIVLSDYIGYNYRVNPKSLSTSYREDRFEQCVKLYNKEKEVLTEIGVWEMAKDRLSRQFFVYLTMCFSQLKNTQFSFSEKCRIIRNICKHEKTCGVISIYPIARMDMKHKIFLTMVKRKLAVLICLYYCA